MRLILATNPRPGAGGDLTRDVGAAVVRARPGGGVVLELGPADGAPHLQLQLSAAEALRLSAAVRGVAGDGGEEILLVED
jgi:hypothetical protein